MKIDASNRSRLLLILAGAAVGLLILDSLVISPLTKAWESRGAEIAKGDKVVLWYVSSNRDEDVYDDADVFDVERNPDHQAFGAGGRHFCLGAALARLELKILLEEMHKRRMRADVTGKVERVRANFVHGFRHLGVTLEKF